MSIAIDHVGIPAADPGASARFLSEILGEGEITPEGPDGEMISLSVGNSFPTFFELPAHEPHHVAFPITERVLAGAIDRLRRCGRSFGNDPEDPANGQSTDPLGSAGRIYSAMTQSPGARQLKPVQLSAPPDTGSREHVRFVKRAGVGDVPGHGHVPGGEQCQGRRTARREHHRCAPGLVDFDQGHGVGFGAADQLDHRACVGRTGLVAPGMDIPVQDTHFTGAVIRHLASGRHGGEISILGWAAAGERTDLGRAAAAWQQVADEVTGKPVVADFVRCDQLRLGECVFRGPRVPGLGVAAGDVGQEPRVALG